MKRSARTFFLNETHQSIGERSGGGGATPQLAPINWEQRSIGIAASLQKVSEKLKRSHDPVKGSRQFLLAQPEPTVLKTSTAKNKPPTFEEPTNFAGKAHARALSRLGADVLEVDSAGNAIVDVTGERFQQLALMSTQIATLGKLQQSRWALLRSFDLPKPEHRLDLSWFKELTPEGGDTIIELQPTLTRAEVDRVFNYLSASLQHPGQDHLQSAGTDYSGRAWLRGVLTRDTIKKIAHDLLSVQTIHPPFYSYLSAPARRKGARASPKAVPPAPARPLPTVGIVDGGIPEGHEILASYRRGTFNHPQSLPGVTNRHASSVASRSVFGEIAHVDANWQPPAGRTRYLDVKLPLLGADLIDTKAVVNGIQQAIGAYPDVRVFNLSFGDYAPVESLPEKERHERLRLVQDLDNLAFAADVIIVVAAGNTTPGQVPSVPYPNNYVDPDWGLGSWACAYNALVVGAYVPTPNPAGLAKQAGAPSPFCKAGPTIFGALKPEFSAGGGDSNEQYQGAPGLGVWVCTNLGHWEDQPGTSYAAPIVARECALALDKLTEFCPPGSTPFAATVKAFMALTAARTELPPRFVELAKRTLGMGRVSAERLSVPDADSAVFVWQGTLSAKSAAITVQVPIPSSWTNDADDPVLRLSVAWNTPTNSALTAIYGCRKVAAKFRAHEDARPLTGKRPGPPAVDGYPLIIREYPLRPGIEKTEEAGHEVGDIWWLELSYEQIADTPSPVDFTEEQKVGVCFELFDQGESSKSPQAAIQELEVAASMTLLSSTPLPTRAPIIIRN